MEKIIIHWDYTDGSELSYIEGLDKQDSFTTHCLNFFTTKKDVRVVRKNGSYIDAQELLENNGNYTNKEIRSEHNLMKMLVAGAFKWKT